MKRKHIADARLTLSRETLRRLTGADLERVVMGGGAGIAQITRGCTTYNTCDSMREPTP